MSGSATSVDMIRNFNLNGGLCMAYSIIAIILIICIYNWGLYGLIMLFLADFLVGLIVLEVIIFFYIFAHVYVPVNYINN